MATLKKSYNAHALSCPCPYLGCWAPTALQHFACYTAAICQAQWLVLAHAGRKGPAAAAAKLVDIGESRQTLQFWVVCFEIPCRLSSAAAAFSPSAPARTEVACLNSLWQISGRASQTPVVSARHNAGSSRHQAGKLAATGKGWQHSCPGNEQVCLRARLKEALLEP